jgi:hypothetical protein
VKRKVPMGMKRLGAVAPLLLAAATAGCLLLAACGGEEEEAGAPSETPAAEETPEVSETPVVGDFEGPLPKDVEELGRTLGERFYETSARVTYDVDCEYSLAGETEGDEWWWRAEGSTTLYWRPPDWRMDFAGTQGGRMGGELLSLFGPELEKEEFEVQMEATYILIGADYYICQRLVSGEELLAELEQPAEDEAFKEYIEGLMEGRCQHQEATGDEELPAESIWLWIGGLLSGPDAYADFFHQSFEDVTDQDISEREIEGQEAICLSASYSGPEGEGESQSCFTNDGVPLLYSLKGSGPGSSAECHMEVASLSREVSDADFEPPYPVE